MADLSKADKKALVQKWKADQSNGYILTEENVQELFEYLEKQLDDSCCDHTLRHTEQWLKDNLSSEKAEKAIAEIREQGGYCDCEVLLNCYEEYDID